MFVVSLTRGLELLRFYAAEQPTAAQLGERVVDDIRSTPELAAMSAEHVEVSPGGLGRGGREQREIHDRSGGREGIGVSRMVGY